jgi:hypothetical protein
MLAQVVRDVFPERFSFEPFGDPYESKRRMQEKKAQEAPEQPNAPGLPVGSYLGSCTGCSLTDNGATLSCTQCRDTRLARHVSFIALDACDDGDVIGNHNGVLACEPKPTPLAEAESVDRGEL